MFEKVYNSCSKKDKDGNIIVVPDEEKQKSSSLYIFKPNNRIRVYLG